MPFLGKLGTKAEAELVNHVPDLVSSNGASAIATASYIDVLTGVSADPIGFAKITLKIDGSVSGNSGSSRNFGDSRFSVTFTAAKEGNLDNARFDLLSLISADPVTDAITFTNSLYTEYYVGGLLMSSLTTNPVDAFGTYEWLFPFDASAAWTFGGGLGCQASTFANTPDSSNLSCLLDNSATWMGISFLDPGGNALTNASASSLSGQNYNQPYSPYTGGAGGVPEPASWAMLIAGFGLVGAAARRRRLQIA